MYSPYKEGWRVLLSWDVNSASWDTILAPWDAILAPWDAILLSWDVNSASREAILVVGYALSRVHSVNCVSKVKHLSSNTAFDRNSRSDAKAVSYFRTARIDIVPIYCMEAGMFFVILFNKREGSRRVSWNRKFRNGLSKHDKSFIIRDYYRFTLAKIIKLSEINAWKEIIF